LPIRVLALLSLLLAPFQGSAPHQAPPADPASADRAAISKLLANQQAAWNAGDVAAFMQGYWRSPDLTFAGSTGLSKGWEAVFSRYQQKYPDKAAMGALEFNLLEIRLLDHNAALVIGKWHLTRTSGDIGGIFSLVFQRFPEGWRIVHDHTS